MKQLLQDAIDAINHLELCANCAESSLSECGGGQDAIATREKLAAALKAASDQPDLHSQIMNLPAPESHYPTQELRLAYKEGHRAARHAAAELVCRDNAKREGY